MAGKLTAKQVEHVAKLANLPITTEETSQFQKQLSETVEYVGEISKVKTQKSKLDHEEKVRTREDKVNVEQCLTQEEATSGGKNVHNGLFVAQHVFGDK